MYKIIDMEAFIIISIIVGFIYLIAMYFMIDTVLKNQKFILDQIAKTNKRLNTK